MTSSFQEKRRERLRKLAIAHSQEKNGREGAIREVLEEFERNKRPTINTLEWADEDEVSEEMKT